MILLRESTFLLMVSFAGVASGQDALEASFKSEAPLGWQALEGKISRLSGSFVEVSDTIPNKGNSSKHRPIKVVVEFHISPDAKKVVTDFWDESGKWESRRVHGMNPDYAFKAAQTVQGGDYYITECGNGKTRDDIENIILFAGINLVRSSFGIESDVRTLQEIVQSEGFKILKCTSVPHEGRELVQVKCQFNPIGLAAEQHPGPTTATLLLDPDAHWRVVRSESQYVRRDGQSVSSDMEVTYSDGAAEEANISRIAWHLKDGSGYLTNTVDFSALSNAPIPSSDFYLPSLGLPDCPGINVQGPPSPWKLLLIGINLLVVGTVLAVILRRKFRPRPAP
ncbi:MAG: hypothetical protein KF708_11720 [Pirellulales bacterium]|nr:hypothetical protein [Pirellulales bacterium]